MSAQIDLTAPDAASKALRTFFRIAEAWRLSDAEQITLLGAEVAAFQRWKANDVQQGLDASTLERLSLIFGIYAALKVLLPVADRADAWISKPNAAPMFGGRSALDRMLDGQVSDLYAVRQYLDAQRWG